MRNKLYEKEYEFNTVYSPKQSYNTPQLSNFLAIHIQNKPDSIGMKLSQKEISMLKLLHKQLKKLNTQKKQVETKITEIMKKHCVNLSKLAGELLSAQ